MDPKTNLIDMLDASRAKMQAILTGIDTGREIYPQWTIKQVLAHITGWDEATTTSLRAHTDSKQPGTPAARGIDYYNAQSVAEREALPYHHVVVEWHQARDDLKRTIQALPDEKLNESLLFPWGQTGTVAQIVYIMAHHETEHAEEIRGLLGLTDADVMPVSRPDESTSAPESTTDIDPEGDDSPD